MKREKSKLMAMAVCLQFKSQSNAHTDLADVSMLQTYLLE